jgi:SAM-dependent methyltransferase
MFLEENVADILSLFNSSSNSDELEIMFNNYKSNNKLTSKEFNNIFKYVKYLQISQKKSITENISLDLCYNYDKNSIYRVTIDNSVKIESFRNTARLKKNHIIFSLAIMNYKNTTSGISVMKKEKSKNKILDIDEYDLRCRVSKELKVTSKELEDISKLNSTLADNITFRYKHRASYILIENNIFNVRIDLTTVKQSNNLIDINDKPTIYEVEVEIEKKKEIKENDLIELLKIIERLKKIIIGNSILLKNSEIIKILEKYKKICYDCIDDKTPILYTMQPLSLEIQHLVDKLPHKYAVSDKADGDKYSLFVYKNSVYLISLTLNVVKLNVTPIKKMSKTLIEGEYIYISSKRKFLFMAFDVLFYKGKDIRSVVSYQDRLKKCSKIISYLNKSHHKQVQYSDNFNLTKIEEYYVNDIKNFYENLNKTFETIAINDILVEMKYFIFPLGGNISEVYMYTNLIWESCTINKNINCPYSLDGIIFTGTNQKYTTNKKEWVYPIYKYKPPSHNSLDIYIRFKRNKDNGSFIIMYDNSYDQRLKGQTYRIAEMFVGENVQGKEIPVPFLKRENNDEAFFPLIDGEVRDIHGNVVKDKSVIEIVYNNDISIPHNYRWSILRTRYDKTELVEKKGIKYGNYSTVAEKAWLTIKEALVIDDFKSLANEYLYTKNIKLLKNRIDTSVIIRERRQDVYYQQITNLVKPMREFNNWMKSILIYSYCSPRCIGKQSKKSKLSVLDLGCGRGGDNWKMYHARISNYVGIDPSYDGIHSSTDGAISRYTLLKNTYPDAPNMTFIQADARTLLNSKEQSKAITNMTTENIDLIKNVFDNNTKFDVINSQFSIHYMFEDNKSVENLLVNINNNLKDGGYILLTLFDGNKIYDLLKGKENYTSTYIDENGDRIKLFEIIKKYEDTDDINKPNLAVDVFMRWISEEGKYQREYLVSMDYIKEKFKSIGLKLIDTELFENVYEMNRSYFTDVIQHEENPKNKIFYEKVAQFYNLQKNVDKESFKYMSLFRYYIFQKI